MEWELVQEVQENCGKAVMDWYGYRWYWSENEYKNSNGRWSIKEDWRIGIV